MKFRHEWKHEINKGDYYELRARLSSIAYPDKNGVNGRYIVRSLYFDDLNDTALMEKINGVSKREKFRIRYVGSVSILDMIITLVLSFAIGLFIFMVYKKTYNGVMYSSSFGVTLIALTMITNVLILAVTSNVVLSLGMVGALSIVRFRTAIKEPLDIAFLFWSIAVGIILAAGFLPLAVI